MNIQDMLRQAAAALSRGDFQGARQNGEKVLRTQPRHAAALQIVGIALCQSGQVREGAAQLRKALGNGGDTPANRFNLARALIDLGELDEAETLTAGADRPRELQRLHADILKAQGRLWEAVQGYERLVAADPGDFESWNNLGNARLASGELDGAFAALQQARALQPQSAQIHTNIGRVLASKERHDDSLLLFQEAVRLSPRDVDALLELGQALIRLDRSREALVPLADAARSNGKDPRVFVAMGLAFTDLEDRQRAEQAYRFALSADPKFSPAYLDLGILLEQANRIDELEALVGEADQQGVTGSDLDYVRALLLRRQGRLGEALDRVRGTLPESADPAVRAHFVGQVADQLGQTEVAFAAFEEMHWAMAQTPLGQALDRRAYQHEVERLAERTTPEWLAAWPAAPAPVGPRAPVFMIGFPRSGTTLLDTILMGHGDTHVLEEVPILAKVAEELGDFARIGEIGADEVAHWRARYFEELERIAPGASAKLVIDKNPLSMLRAPLIHRLFPDARIIFALRHPCDVVLSCFMQNFKLTQAMASFLDLTSGSLLYDRVMAYWEQCRGIFPLDVHEIRYEAMIADVEAEVRPLLDFLGLEWDASMLDHQRTARTRGFIRTPSYGQVTEPIYSRAWGRWERYRPQMAQVLPILEPWVARLGYGTTSQVQ